MSAEEFIAAVLALAPRLAVFDCDGTLWAGDSGAEFFYWEIARGLLPKPAVDWAVPRYESYLRGEVSEEAICGEMVTLHAGLPHAALAAAAEEFFAERFESQIFVEMRELVSKLKARGSDVWAVSSTNNWVVEAGVRRFDIAPGHVLAACVHCEDGRATGRLRDVPTGPGKARSIQRELQQPVEAAFGNSVHDREMLALARHPFAINPSRELERIAREHGWPVYYPQRLPSRK